MSAHGWADLRCPDCRGQTYGPVGETYCEMGHPRRMMVPATELDWCGEDAPEKAKAKGVGACVEPPGHTTRHVWWQQFGASLNFYREDRLQGATLALHADLVPGARFSQEEAAAMWQYFQFVAGARTHKRPGPE